MPTRIAKQPLDVTLRGLADGLDPQITALIHSPTSQQRPTAKRARVAQALYQRGQQMQNTQRALRALADAHARGVCPPDLARIRTRAAIELLLTRGEYPTSAYAEDKRAGLARFGITAANYAAAHAALLDLMGATPVAPPRAALIRQAEISLVGRKLPGYFPTPSPIAKMLVDAALIAPGMHVLEPCAGKGDLALAIRAAAADVRVTTVEIQPELRKLLELHDLPVAGSDFFACTFDTTFDRIVMNPPFEGGESLRFVEVAWDLLAPGGRLVSIMPTSIYQRSDRRHAGFYAWLGAHHGQVRPLPEDAFARAERSTYVHTCYIVIDKPE